MMQISVAGTHLLTGDVVATMLLELAAAVGHARLTTTVDLRGYTLTGAPTRAVLLISQHSPLAAMTVQTPL